MDNLGTTNDIAKDLDRVFSQTYSEVEELIPNVKTIRCDFVPGLRFEGAPGIGKTSIIKDWAEKHADKINFFEVSAASLSVTKVTKDGKIYDVVFTTEQAKELAKPNTVFFIDDYQLISPEVEAIVEDMMITRKMADISAEDGETRLDGILFQVVAVTV